MKYNRILKKSVAIIAAAAVVFTTITPELTFAEETISAEESILNAGTVDAAAEGMVTSDDAEVAVDDGMTVIDPAGAGDEDGNADGGYDDEMPVLPDDQIVSDETVSGDATVSANATVSGDAVTADEGCGVSYDGVPVAFENEAPVCPGYDEEYGAEGASGEYAPVIIDTVSGNECEGETVYVHSGRAGIEKLSMKELLNSINPSVLIQSFLRHLRWLKRADTNPACSQMTHLNL
ncbi:MAG: hypothetical protein K6F34_09620 [Lachnospiraceae bacterium]|nr:hypothetical protein [Lachnospiraceae bacterium]